MIARDLCRRHEKRNSAKKLIEVIFVCLFASYCHGDLWFFSSIWDIRLGLASAKAKSLNRAFLTSFLPSVWKIWGY
jgi:hypothetical protein